MHMLDPDRYLLSDEESRKLEVLKRAFVIISENPIRTEAMRLIQELEGYSSRTPYRIYEEVQNLFGRFADTNRKLDRMLQRERVMQLWKLAQGDKDKGIKADLWLALECEKVLMKITGTDNFDEKEDTETELPALYLTPDVSVLMSAQAEDVSPEDDDR